MEADYLHLIVNHIPIFSVGFGLPILAWGLIKKNNAVIQVALVLFLIGAVSSYVAMETGEAAEDIVEEMNIASNQVIHDHEEAAEIAFWFTVLTGVISAIALFTLSYQIRWQNTLFGILFIAGLISLGTLLYTAYQGGKIFHPKTQQTGERELSMNIVNNGVPLIKMTAKTEQQTS